VVACKTDCVENILVNFSAEGFLAQWKYNSSTTQYQRYELKKPHLDQDGSPILADTIIVQHVQTTVLDEVGRLKMDTIGEGKAIVFTKGNVVEGTWKKENATARTKWYNNGNEIVLSPGKIWIEVVNERTRVEY